MKSLPVLTPKCIARFWKHTRKTDTCWLWSKHCNRKGYGWFSAKSEDGIQRQWQAHRIAYLIAYDVLPDDLCVCHKCDVPGCVNPDHLFLGTIADNNHDAIAKGRARFVSASLLSGGNPSHGEAHWKSKTNASHVVAMRSRYASGGITLEELGIEFGLDPRTVHKIIQRRSWRHVE